MQRVNNFLTPFRSLVQSTCRKQLVPLFCRSFSNNNSPLIINSLSGDDSGITLLTLNNPPVNALNKSLLSSIKSSINSLNCDNSTRVIILNSSNKNVFCAGADLKERKSMSPEEAQIFVSSLRSTFNDFSNIEKPTIACINGSAFGGGLELALCCDMRVGNNKNTLLGLTETSLAIIPGAGGTQRLPRLIGISKAKELIFTAKKINGLEAYELGLLNLLSEYSDSYDYSLLLARKIINNGPIAIKAAKKAINLGMEQLNLENAMEIEKQCYDIVLKSKDRIRGLQAFEAKQIPLYEGD